MLLLDALEAFAPKSPGLAENLRPPADAEVGLCLSAAAASRQATAARPCASDGIDARPLNVLQPWRRDTRASISCERATPSKNRETKNAPGAGLRKWF